MALRKGKCKLCLKEKDLCKESHIIPRFLYKFLAGENNAVVYLDAQRAQTRYNYEYEGDILCIECDTGILGKLDDYAAKLLENRFRNKTAFRIEVLDGKQYQVVENDPNYDYARFKLFLLSILWRGGISSRPFFEQVQLAAEVEEDLRRMILNSAPGEPEEYACFVALPPLVNDPQYGLGFDASLMPTMTPYCAEKSGLEMCRFVIQGVHYIFILHRAAPAKVVPGVTRNKLMLGFTPLEEQMKLLQLIVDTMRKHKR